MSRFYVDLNSLTSPWLLYPTDQDVFDAAMENNTKVTMWRDLIEDRVVAECENKPRDMAVFGIRWKPMEKG